MTMWQRFTERARRAVFFAQEVAGLLGENYVSPEHLLLGLLREDDTVATRILDRLGISLPQIREMIENQMTPGDGRLGQDMQLTPQTKRAIDLAYDEARELGNNYIGTEHLLLGLVRLEESLAGQTLVQQGATLVRVRAEVRLLQDSEPSKSSESATVRSSSTPDSSPLTFMQRFSEHTRKLVANAIQEAKRLQSHEVMPEHILFGLIRVDDCKAVLVLNKMDVSIKRIQSELERKVARGNAPADRHPGMSSAVIRIIEMAKEESEQLKSGYIGSEHLLLGLIRASDSLAQRVLVKAGVRLEQTRQEIKSLLPKGDSSPAPNVTVMEPDESSTQKGKRPGWQRFTERSRRVVFFAQEEAGRLGENYVSTEHLLLGLVRENDSVAARILDRMGVSLGHIRSEIERQVTRGDGRLGQDMQLTPRAKRVIDLAYDEARQLGNNYIGTEHLLLGLIREGEGLAGRVLAKLGIELERTRHEVKVLQDQKEEVQNSRQSSSHAATAEQMHGQALQWKGQSLISLMTVPTMQFRGVLAVAGRLKPVHQDRFPPLAGRTLAMLFEKPSLRTRVSFEVGMAHLGGHAVYLGAQEIGLGTRESVPDVAAALSRWVDGIAARVFKHETVEELAAHASVPVINALSDKEHPCQAFADLLTIQEHKGELGSNLKVAYIGDGNNVLHALLLGCAKTGVNITAACPEGYLPESAYVEEAKRIVAEDGSGAQITVVTDPAEAVQDADVLYTDVWSSMGQESEQKARAKVFAPYQLNAELVAKAKPDAIVLHCLPAHRGEEITDDVFEAHKKTILDQAENRLHTQKALLLLILGQ